jgi:hypothetical protein
MERTLLVDGDKLDVELEGRAGDVSPSSLQRGLYVCTHLAGIPGIFWLP